MLTNSPDILLLRQPYIHVFARVLIFGAAMFFSVPSLAADSEPGSGCELILVVPQNRHDPAGNAFAFKSWLAKVRKEFAPCDRFVTGTTATDILALINIHDVSDAAPLNLGERQISSLRDARAFTQLLLLKYAASDHYLQIEPELFDIEQDHLEAIKDGTRELTIPLTETSPKFAPSLGRRLWNSMILQPNALLVGASTATLINQREQNNEVIEVDHQQTSVLPPFVNGFSLTSIEHPNGFANWDISSRLFTSFNLIYFQDSYTYLTDLKTSPKDPNTLIGTKTDYSLRLYGVAVGLNEEVTFHTMIGGFFASVGLGVAPYIYHDTLGEGFYGVSLIARGAGGYRAFLTNRFYIQAGVELIHPMPQYVSNSVFVSNITSYAFAGIGLFLPGLRNQL